MHIAALSTGLQTRKNSIMLHFLFEVTWQMEDAQLNKQRIQ